MPGGEADASLCGQGPGEAGVPGLPGPECLWAKLSSDPGPVGLRLLGWASGLPPEMFPGTIILLCRLSPETRVLQVLQGWWLLLEGSSGGLARLGTLVASPAARLRQRPSSSPDGGVSSVFHAQFVLGGLLGTDWAGSQLLG